MSSPSEGYGSGGQNGINSGNGSVDSYQSAGSVRHSNSYDGNSGDSDTFAGWGDENNS